MVSNKTSQKNAQKLAPVEKTALLKKKTNNYQKAVTSKYRKLLKRKESTIHGNGVFALAQIERNQKLIEYTGDRISNERADIREKMFQQQGLFSSYMFRLNADWVLDATRRGNMSKFINHCCQPNCKSKCEKGDDGVTRIVIYAKKRIKEGEELTLNYMFPYEEVKIECTCGAKKCQKFLN